MKKLEFETSKGKFLLIDQLPNGKVLIPDIEHTEICRLKLITEEQASEIVDESIFSGLFAHYIQDIEVNTYCYDSAIESLRSLLKSKGVHLFENPIKERFVYFGGKKVETFEYQESERKTFYNPYIFKI